MRSWFTAPWRDAKCAAGLVAELCRCVLPPPKHLEANSYYQTLVALTLTEDDTPGNPTPKSQLEIIRAINFVETFANGDIYGWSLPGHYHDDPTSRVYWAATEYGQFASFVAWNTAVTAPDDPARLRGERWWAVGEMARLGCKVIEKWAASSEAGGYAHNSILALAINLAVDAALMDTDQVAEIVCKHRFRDALGEQEPTEDKRLAFEALFEIGDVASGYRLIAAHKQKY